MMKRPNILFIMCDDHAWQAISAYGSKVNHTPNIDRIAKEGARLDHCYVTNSICTPSRAAILTGTHNHVNGVTTLSTPLDNTLPNVAKHLRTGGYQTALFGKWHLGNGPEHCPTGFDQWSVVPGQGEYFNPMFIEKDTKGRIEGYATDIITEKCVDFIKERDCDKPFFLMCHHKAPHRPWQYHPRHKDLYTDEIPYPETFDDDYQNRAQVAKSLRMRIERHLNYRDLDLVLPEKLPEHQVEMVCTANVSWNEKLIPFPETDEEVQQMELVCAKTGERFEMQTREQLKKFKYQRYMQKYLRTVQAVDESVGKLLATLEAEGLTEDTMVIYTSDQGFYLGEHGWFDKRLIYEESFKMPFLVKYPKTIKAGSVIKEMASNVDFAPTWLEYAGLPIPSYMQGYSLKGIFERNVPENWQDVAYHRYWMNEDSIHNACAHYGIRDHRYKLVYWYNEPCGTQGSYPGTLPEKEWELFDCEKDPLELFNCFHAPDKRDIVEMMLAKLDRKQAEIGDVPEHDTVGVLAQFRS